MTLAIETFRGSDGLTLARCRWCPPDPWATVLLVHGLAEHVERYDHVGVRFARSGLELIGADLRGFGRSGGPRAFVDRWEVLYDDLELQVREIRSSFPGRPLVLYGHSLGGLIVLGYVLDGREAPDALVLSAPAIAATIPAWKHALARVLGRVAPHLTLANPLDGAALSKDPSVGADYAADPLNVHRSTTRLGAEAFRAQRVVHDRLGRLRVPTLVIHGADDPIVPVGSTAVIGELPGVVRRVYPGVRHELHNDLERDAVLDDVVSWIRSTVGRTAGVGVPTESPTDPLAPGLGGRVAG